MYREPVFQAFTAARVRPQRGILQVGALLIGTLLAPSSASAVITLTEPFQPGDYAVWNDDGASTNNNFTFFQARPDASGGTTVSSVFYGRSSALAFDALAAPGKASGSFAPNGDYYYTAGASFDDGGQENFSGRQLWRILAGETTSTLLSSNLDVGGLDTRDFNSIAASSDGTVYIARHQSPSIVKAVPSTPGGTDYTSGYEPEWSPDNATSNSTCDFGCSLELSNDGLFLIKGAARNGNPLVEDGALNVIDTSTGAVVSLPPILPSLTGPYSRVGDFAVDYARGLDANGNLRVLLTNVGSAFFEFDENNPGFDSGTITQIDFNPVTGMISNPYANFGSGGGILGSLPDGQAVINAEADGNLFDFIAFDNNGNLVVQERFASNGESFRSFTQAQLDGVAGTPLSFTDGTVAWSGLGSSSSVRDFTIAPGEATVLAGDFDTDGDVDGADFLSWQRNTTIGSLSDWQANYGMPSALAAGVGAVPEPTTGMLLVLGMLLTAGRRSRKGC